MRLTQKNEYFEYILPEKSSVGDKIASEISICLDGWTADQFIVGEAIRQFGLIEDVLGKYNIETSTDLEKILNKYFNKENKNGKINR